MTRQQARAGFARYWPRLFLIIPFLLVAWVPFYNRVEPTLGNIPFFYWYQLAAILIGAVVVLFVYALETRIARGTKRSQDELDTSGTPGDIL